MDGIIALAQLQPLLFGIAIDRGAVLEEDGCRIDFGNVLAGDIAVINLSRCHIELRRNINDFLSVLISDPVDRSIGWQKNRIVIHNDCSKHVLAELSTPNGSRNFFLGNGMERRINNVGAETIAPVEAVSRNKKKRLPANTWRSGWLP